jgi:hypothetical protein
LIDSRCSWLTTLIVGSASVDCPFGYFPASHAAGTVSVYGWFAYCTVTPLTVTLL